MIDKFSDLTVNDISAESILNWVLPAVGTVLAVALIIYLWRYLKKSNEVGRISEFDERTFKKLIVEKGADEFIPICEKCKMPMRVEIHYKDFMKDQGEFLISRETAKKELQSLVDGDRILEEDMSNILEFFNDNPKIKQQLFKRYKCSNCSAMKVFPYQIQSQEK
ncbi:MAG: hypothetical protein EAX90_07175 [Candidatus Heimdallarchaeota archaeon]|nr:hypothetical protein [Candidatus Heimdallarchaeota archaeon]